jgi:hypothetical protein
MANQASMARRQRERKRMQKRREKQALRSERREAKKEADKVVIPADPMEDPTIDWGSAVREGHNLAMDPEEAEEEAEESEEAGAE